MLARRLGEFLGLGTIVVVATAARAQEVIGLPAVAWQPIGPVWVVPVILPVAPRPLPMVNAPRRQGTVIERHYLPATKQDPFRLPVSSTAETRSTQPTSSSPEFRLGITPLARVIIREYYYTAEPEAPPQPLVEPQPKTTTPPTENTKPAAPSSVSKSLVPLEPAVKPSVPSKEKAKSEAAKRPLDGAQTGPDRTGKPGIDKSAPAGKSDAVPPRS